MSLKDGIHNSRVVESLCLLKGTLERLLHLQSADYNVIHNNIIVYESSIYMGADFLESSIRV